MFFPSAGYWWDGCQLYLCKHLTFYRSLDRSNSFGQCVRPIRGIRRWPYGRGSLFCSRCIASISLCPIHRSYPLGCARSSESFIIVVPYLIIFWCLYFPVFLELCSNLPSAVSTYRLFPFWSCFCPQFRIILWFGSDRWVITFQFGCFCE